MKFSSGIQTVLLLLSTTLVDKSLSMRPENFCVLTSNVSNEAKCKYYQCSEQVCSTDKNKCETFIDWTTLLDSDTNIAKVTLKKYEVFVVNIKSCSSKQYVLMKNEACRNRKICFARKNWSSRLMLESVRLLEKKKCPCLGRHGYDCGNGYCSVNKFTCQELFRDGKYSNIIKNIKVCN